MADPYIGQFETQSYGPFAVAQVASLAVGVDANYDALLLYLSGVVTARTRALNDLLTRAADHVVCTYKPAEGEVASWLVAYGALKLAVESLLKLTGKVRLMPEIFDDLAEVHRAPDVHDATPSDPKPA